MEVRIGVQNAAREVVIDTDETAENVEKQIVEAVSAGGVITLVDHKGKRTIVPAAKLAYVEIGTGTLGAVGFRS